MPRPSTKQPTESGARLAALRKSVGISQNRLAKILGIPQRTLSFYERDARHIPSSLVPKLAKALSVSVDEVLGVDTSPARRRGPKSKLEVQLEAIRNLPRNKQQKLLAVVEAFVAQHAE
jgi:transcriptional regulator with XRE-family HTH domain